MNLDLRRIWLGFAIVVFPAFSFLTAHAHPEAFAAKQQDIVMLEPGKPIERELKANEIHSYAITLTAGQYTRIELQPRGMWVAWSLLTPNREVIAAFASIGTFWGRGTQNVHLVAEQTGHYYVQLRAGDPGASPALYAVHISPPREATAQDQERFAVQKIYAQYPMNTLPRSRVPADIRDSLKNLAEALLLSQKIQDQELEAMLLHEIGWRYSFDLNNEPEAIARFERALELRRTLGHKNEQAVELISLGYSHYMLGKLEQARAYYEQSRPLFLETGDRIGEGTTFLRMGMSYNRESLSNSINYYLQAEPLFRGIGGEIELQLMYEMIRSWAYLGEPQNALAVSRNALALAEPVEWKGMKANTLIHLSQTYQTIGDYQLALDAIHQALAISKASDYLDGEARATYTIASQYLEMGDAQRAVGFYQQSIRLFQQMGHEARKLRPQCELPQAYVQLGQPEAARDYALSILPLTRKYNDKLSEGSTLTGLGRAYQALGEDGKAVECFAQAATIFREMQFPGGEAQAIHDGAAAQSAQRNFPQALTLYQQSLALAQKLNYPLIEAKSLTGIARVEQRLGHTAEARSNFEAALKIIESVRSRIVSPALRATFQAAARDAYESYVALLMQLHRQQPTAGYSTAALQIRERARARSLVEMLTEAPAKIRAEVKPNLLKRADELTQKLKAKSSGQIRAASQSEEQLATFSREITALTAELEQVESQIRTASPRYAALAQPQPLTVAEIQKEVVNDANTILLEYALGEEKSWLWAVTATGIQSFELPKRAEIEAAARRVYDLLTARNQRPKFEEDDARRARIQQADAEFPHAAAALSRMILAPVASQLGNKRLLIVADGALQYVPFGALPEPVVGGRWSVAGKKQNQPPVTSHQPLIAAHEIVSLPSASTLAVLRRELAGRKAATKSIAVIADPVFEKTDARLSNAVAVNEASQKTTTRGEWWQSELERSARDVGIEGERAGFARLPATRAEAQAAVKFAPPNSSLTALDFAANQTTATSEALSQYRYVHFATHGVLNNEHPELSGLVLSLVDEKGKDTDGFLRLVEIYNLKLPSEMVTLSACRTGLGKEIKGEGLMSLTRGFMYAGAARVMVSLWDVNDASTAALMSRTYQSILQEKLSPAAALRKAQNTMRQDSRWSAPYYWAAFTLHGEPR
ncbi:MAG: CHAT domain-containing protein [Blastocatellia bacterium]|nr:CHAT domain-containing protein [Blastocatellia bacterium]